MFMNHVKSLLALMPFSTFDEKYQSRMVQPNREELELVLDGQAVLQSHGTSEMVGPGHLIWHRSGDRTIYSNARSDKYECLIIAFEVEESTICRQPRHSYWQGMISARQFSEDALSAFYALQNQPRADMQAFCHYLYSACQIHSNPVPESKDMNDRTLEKAMQFISENFTRNIGIEEIASAAHISASHLHFLFKAHFGKTPHQSLNQYRMEKAVELLRHQQLPVKQLTSACGFESESGFLRAFKRKYGVSPGAYRKLAVVS